MTFFLPRCCLFTVLCLLLLFSNAQNGEGSEERTLQLPDKFFTNLENKATNLDKALSKQTEKYISRLASKEEKLRRKLYKVDSAAAIQLFAGCQEKYQYLLQQLKNAAAKQSIITGAYMPYTDSLKGMLSFFDSQKNILHANAAVANKITGAVKEFNQLQSRIAASDQIKQYIDQRKQQLQQVFTNYAHIPGVKKYLTDYAKQAVYYKQQVKEYKEMLNDPDKLQQKALSLLSKLPAFKKFMQQHSMLAGFFNVPGDNLDLTGENTSLTGLPTREQVMAFIQTKTGAALPNVNALVQNNITSAGGQLATLRDKLNSFGSNVEDPAIPGLKLNNEKTKTFFQRLEYGSNLQTVSNSWNFPVTTDFAFTIGYKIRNNCSIGIGASYKLGWGTGIKDIHLRNQGFGIRSYLDMPLKKTFYASGGFEYNYQPPVAGAATKGALLWQQSWLIGISKIVALKTKFLKKSKLQLLWDFLSYQQSPSVQPLKFRIGYGF